MKYIILVLSAFCLLSFTVIDWEPFVSFEGKFKVLTPGTLKDTIKVVDTEIGSIEYHTYFYQPEDKRPDNLVYMISYCDYPEYSIHSDSIELLNDFFETTIETATQSVKGELIYASEINLKDYPGRRWRIDYAEGNALIKTKAFMVGRRYYSIQTITLKEKSLNLSTDKFLDSFAIID